MDRLSQKVESLITEVYTAATKTGAVVKALANRFNGEVSILSERISGVEAPGAMDGVSVSDLSVAPPLSSSGRLLAGYHHFKTNRYVVGRTVAEEERLSGRHGFNTVAYFDNEEEMRT